MADLQELVDSLVERGRTPGAVALVGRRDGTEVAYAGVRTLGGAPMTRDTVFRVASITKPITAAATMVLVDRGQLGLDDPVAPLLPELADPVVLRRPDGAVDDVVPAVRPITLRHLLTFTAGLGLPERFDLPISRLLVDELAEGPPRPAEHPPTDEWMARIARTPLLHQPGEGWTYNTCADLLGVLLSRRRSEPLADVLVETVLEPLAMRDTGFRTTATDRMCTFYRRHDDGLSVVDPPDGQWTRQPAFESGASGLVSTVDDWATFGRMLLAGGEHAGRRILSPESVRLMTTSHHDGGEQHLFLDGQGWGFGGGVDLRATHPWTVPGRYGWVGGTGTAGYVIPSTGTVVVWLNQVELAGPDDFATMAEVLSYAAR